MGWKRIFNKYPLMSKASGIDRLDIYNRQAAERSYVDNIKFCNDAGGSKYQPLQKGVATQKTTSNLRRVIGGQIDFGFEQKYLNKQIQESSNYKLKGGDS